MLDFLNFDHDDAINILKDDHNKVKDLFDRFEETDKLSEKKKIAAQCIMELKIHTEIEEKLFYPTVRNAGIELDIMNEADEEHHVAKLLIAELEQMNGSEDHWEAKFMVLAESVRHHIREEEGEMMPQARQSDIDFILLGQDLLQMKQQLKRGGVPQSPEERLISRVSQAKKRIVSIAKAIKKRPAAKKPKLSLVAKKGKATAPAARTSYSSSSKPRAKKATASKRKKR